jgi:hypothetical protein
MLEIEEVARTCDVELGQDLGLTGGCGGALSLPSCAPRFMESDCWTRSTRSGLPASPRPRKRNCRSSCSSRGLQAWPHRIRFPFIVLVLRDWNGES